MNQPPLIHEPPVIPPAPPAVYIHATQPPRSNTGIVLVLSLVLLVGLVVGVGMFVDSSVRRPAPATASKALPANPKDIASLYVSLGGWQWQYSINGNAGSAHFVITNGSQFDIKDPVISYIEYGHSGTPIVTNSFTLYEIIPAGQTLNIDGGINLGYLDPQTSTTGAYISDFTLVQQ